MNTKLRTLPLIVLFCAASTFAQNKPKLIPSPASTPGLDSTSCWSIKNGSMVVCSFPKNAAAEALRIDTHGEVLETLTPESSENQLCLFDGQSKKELTHEYFTKTIDGKNDPRLRPRIKNRLEGFPVQGYRVSASKVPLNPQPSHIIKDQNQGGLVALRAFSLTRDYDTESPDGPEGGSAKWNVYGIQIVPRSAIALDQDTLWGYQYSKSKSDSILKPTINTTFRALRSTWPQAGISGVFINKKYIFSIIPDIHGWADLLHGRPAKECEWRSCLRYPGVQTVCYNNEVYGIAKWAPLEAELQKNPDETAVVLIADGDGGPARDDIVGMFEVPLSLLATKQRLIYVGTNSAGGTNFAIEIQLTSPAP